MAELDVTNTATASISTPAAGVTAVFVDSTSKTVCSKDDTGTVVDYGAGASTIIVANETADTTCFPVFVTAATGSLAAKSNAGLTFNSATVNLGSTTFTGTLVGNADSATAVTVANEAADTTCFPLFATAASGTLGAKSNASLTFNSATASLACTTFVGAVTGNASTATALQTARTIGGVSFDGTANITVATATSGFTVSGGNLALGANSLTLTGSIAATGARVTKGWFTDLESTNMPTVGGTAILTSLTAPQFTTIELGNASDTTLARSAAGQMSVEGVQVTTLSNTVTLTNKRITKREVSVADATSITPDSDASDVVTQANTQAAGTLTVNNPTGTPTASQPLTLRVKCTNAQTFSWDTQYRGSSDLALPTTSTGSSKYDYLSFLWNAAATRWDLVGKNFGF